MIEILSIPLFVAGLALIPRKGMDEKKKLKTIFDTVGYGVPKDGKLKTPTFKKKIPIMDFDQEIGRRYVYSIPLGLPATKLAEQEKRMSIFSDGLSRPVMVEFRPILPKDPRKYLVISVFNKDLPRLYPYKDVPEIEGWSIPLGRTLEETIWHNFDDTPHMTVAGTTRFGKTVFLKVAMTYLTEHHPKDVEFYIIDLKGGLEFKNYEKLEQVKKVASDPFEAFELLGQLHDQMEKDYAFFLKNGWNNIKKTPIQKRRFIIVDEAAQLAPEKWMDKKLKDILGACQWYLGEITRLGGGLGYREIFCTQYPTSDTLPRSIKQNSDAKITFRLPSGYASEVAIDELGAEKLPSDVKGRALYKTHELKEMQVPLIEDKEVWKRLGRYQIPTLMEGVPENVVEYREETTETRNDLVEFR